MKTIANWIWKKLGWSYCDEHQRWYKGGRHGQPVCPHCWSKAIREAGGGSIFNPMVGGGSISNPKVGGASLGIYRQEISAEQLQGETVTTHPKPFCDWVINSGHLKQGNP